MYSNCATSEKTTERQPRQRRNGRKNCRVTNVAVHEIASMNKSIDLQPTLTGRQLKLRPLGPEDYGDLYAVAADPLIWEQHPEADRHEADVFRKFFDEALDCNGALVVMDLASSHIIGSSRFYGYDPCKSELEIGWTFLARSHWGGTYNREMKHLMLRHAFRFVNSVIFVVGPRNRRSQRAVEKLGAVRTSSRPRTGGRVDLVYRLTATEFRQRCPDI